MRRLLDFMCSSRLWIVVAFWIALYSWQPWFLGFYYDDWVVVIEPLHRGGPFTWDRWHWLLQFFSDRPMLSVPHFILDSLFNGSTFLWHCGLTVMALFCAVVFYYFLRSLLQLFEKDSPTAAALGAALWICAPWLVGVVAWPTMSTAYIIIPLFAGSALALFNSWRKGESAVIWPALFYLSQLLMYEIFYFQYILIFILGLIAGIHKKVPIRKLAFSFTALTIVQIAAGIYQKMHSFRTVDTGWFRLWLRSVPHVPFGVLAGLHLGKTLLLILFILLLISLCIIGITSYRSLRKQNELPLTALQPVVRPLLGVAITCLAGILMATGILALGGRQINGAGTFARSTLAISFWLFIFLGFSFYWLGTLHGRARKLMVSLVALAFGIMCFYTESRGWDFAVAWQMEQRIIHEAPIDQIRQTARNAVILFDGPIHYHKVYVIYKDYSLSGAMNHYYPDLRSRPGTGNDIHGNGWKPFIIHANYDTVWDGKTVTQRQTVYPASELWLWNYEKGTFTKVSAPFHLAPKKLGI